MLQNFRGELVLLDSREGSGGGRGAFNEDFGNDDFGGGAPREPNPGRSRPRSMPTSTTTSRFDELSSLRAVAAMDAEVSSA